MQWVGLWAIGTGGDSCRGSQLSKWEGDNWLGPGGGMSAGDIFQGHWSGEMLRGLSRTYFLNGQFSWV